VWQQQKVERELSKLEDKQKADEERANQTLVSGKEDLKVEESDDR